MTSTRLWRLAVLVKTRVWLGCSVCGLIKPGVGYSYLRIFLGTLRSVIIGLFFPCSQEQSQKTLPVSFLANGVWGEVTIPKFFLEVLSKSQWNLNATHEVSGNQIKFSLHRLFSNWLQGNGFSFFYCIFFRSKLHPVQTLYFAVLW